MGFDFDRSEMHAESAAESVLALMEQMLDEKLLAERAAIDSYRRIAAAARPQGEEAALRLVRVVLAVEEEHAEILTTVRDTLRNLKQAAG